MGAGGGCRADRFLRAADPRSGEAAAGTHGGWLRLPRRSAAAARSGLDPDRDIGASGARLLREPRPELGARRADQGARLRRRCRRRRGTASRAVAVRLAQIPRLRDDRRRPRDEAADPRLSRPRRHRGRGPQYQARPRRHSRDRVLCSDPAAHCRRTAQRAARPRDRRHARRARRRRLDRRGGPRRAHRGLLFSAPRRTSPADDGRRADPYAAVRSAGTGRFRPFPRLSGP